MDKPTIIENWDKESAELFIKILASFWDGLTLEKKEELEKEIIKFKNEGIK